VTSTHRFEVDKKSGNKEWYSQKRNTDKFQVEVLSNVDLLVTHSF
jgi:hypothetical protein